MFARFSGWFFTCTLGVILFTAGSSVVAVPAELFKELPPPGEPISGSTADTLTHRASRLTEALQKLSSSDDLTSDLPNVAVLVRAVELAVEQNLFYHPRQVKWAAALLDEAERRIVLLRSGQRGWDVLIPESALESGKLIAPTPIVAGHVSKIDGSTQPLGWVLPAGFDSTDTRPRRLDVWLHGRGEQTVELQFLDERMKQVGAISPADTIVLHPFGRHCVAYKFAGETDVLEAIDRTAELVTIDPHRILMRGFSMGGAGVWHLGAHYPTNWLAINPGAGFVETLIYQKWTVTSPLPIDDVQKKLLNWYDVLPSVNNFRGTHVLAYSGEIDPQRAAAEMVIARAKQSRVPTRHVIGAGMGHKIDPASAKIMDQQLARWSAPDRSTARSDIDFTTFTTRYAKADWLTIDGVTQQWTESRVKARLDPAGRIGITCRGITHLNLDIDNPPWSDDANRVELVINGTSINVNDVDPAPGFQCFLVDREGWRAIAGRDDSLRKRPGLQGPIDDAFCDSFLFVIPSRPAIHGEIQRWIERESAYAFDRWRRLMRGDVRVVRDDELTAQQIDDHHLICFGDFSGNLFLHRVADRLPIVWNKESVRVGGKSFDARHHVPVFCFPNPENPSRYVVVNSGMTFRDFSNNSNSRQIAMLPDWSVIDCRSDDDSIFPGKVAAKGFFDERWRMPLAEGGRLTEP